MKTESFLDQFAKHGNYQAPRGSRLHAKSWQTEAPLRMLLNNLDKEVAEDPMNFIVYGGTGQAVRNREALELIIDALLGLDPDAPGGAPRVDCQQQPRAPLGYLGAF